MQKYIYHTWMGSKDDRMFGMQFKSCNGILRKLNFTESRTRNWLLKSAVAAMQEYKITYFKKSLNSYDVLKIKLVFKMGVFIWWKNGNDHMIVVKTSYSRKNLSSKRKC